MEHHDLEMEFELKKYLGVWFSMPNMNRLLHTMLMDGGYCMMFKILTNLKDYILKKVGTDNQALQHILNARDVALKNGKILEFNLSTSNRVIRFKRFLRAIGWEAFKWITGFKFKDYEDLLLSVKTSLFFRDTVPTTTSVRYSLSNSYGYTDFYFSTKDKTFEDVIAKQQIIPWALLAQHVQYDSEFVNVLSGMFDRSSYFCSVHTGLIWLSARQSMNLLVEIVSHEENVFVAKFHMCFAETTWDPNYNFRTATNLRLWKAIFEHRKNFTCFPLAVDVFFQQKGQLTSLHSHATRSTYEVFEVSPLIITALNKIQVSAVEFILKRSVTPMLSFIGEPIISANNRMVLASPYKIRSNYMPEMGRLEEFRRLYGMVLSLKTGQGKTLATITACLSRKKRQGVTVILVPDLMVNHWVSELQKHTHFTDFVSIALTKHISRYWSADMVPYQQLIIISHSAFRSKLFQSMKFEVDWLIVDEAHRVKSSSVTHGIIANLKCNFKLLITATPGDNLEQMLGSDKIKNHCHLSPTYFKNFFKDGESMVPCVTEISPVFVAADSTDYDHLYKLYIHFNCICMNYRSSPNFSRSLRIFERICAGGQVDLVVIQQVLKDMFNPQTKEALLVEFQQGEQKPTVFFEPHQDCPICLCKPLFPVTTVCGHVTCLACIESAMKVRPRCVFCRKTLQTPCKIWSLDGSHNNSSSSTEKISKEQLKDMLIGDTLIPCTNVNQNRSLVSLNGKLDLFTVEISSLDPQDNMVVFLSYEKPLNNYIQVLRDHRITYLVAGFEVSRKESIENIEKFRQLGSQVLFLSYQYCFGIDLVRANKMLVVDFSRNMTRLIQSLGRIVRIGQQNATISVKVFMYRDLFDHFIWNMFQNGCTKFRENRSTIIQLEEMTTLNVVDTRVWQTRELAKIIWPGETLKIKIVMGGQRVVVVRNGVTITLVQNKHVFYADNQFNIEMVLQYQQQHQEYIESIRRRYS